MKEVRKSKKEEKWEIVRKDRYSLSEEENKRMMGGENKKERRNKYTIIERKINSEKRENVKRKKIER